MIPNQSGEPPFGAVIVIHNSAQFLPALFSSLREHVSPAPELVVVDTGSNDGGGDLARKAGATVIDRPDNPGFGTANNLGIGAIRSSITALLNPDIELLDGGLLRLAAMARQRRALLAPRLLNPDGSVQRSAHPEPGHPSAIIPALIHPLALPRRMRLAADPWRSEESRVVGWALAACLVAQTDVLRALGPFDEGIFLFYEDLDLALRARQAGVPTELHPSIAVRHFGSHSTLPAYGEEPLELHARLRRDVVGSQLGGRALALDDVAQTLAFATRALARKAMRRDASRELAQVRAVRAARRTQATQPES